MENKEMLNKLVGFAKSRQAIFKKLEEIQAEAQSLMMEDKVLFDKIVAVKDILKMNDQELITAMENYDTSMKEEQLELFDENKQEIEAATQTTEIETMGLKNI